MQREGFKPGNEYGAELGCEWARRAGMPAESDTPRPHEVMHDIGMLVIVFLILAVLIEFAFAA